MPPRAAPLLLLLPSFVVGVLVSFTGDGAATLAASLGTLVGSAVALLLARDSVERQLRALARRTRGRIEGAPPAPASADGLLETAALQGAIDSLHTHLATQNAALSQQARTLAAVLDGMAEGVWVTDARGTVVRHNEALPALLQAPGGPLVGQRPLAIVRHEGLHEAVMRACREGASRQLELTLEGLYLRTLSVSVTPLGRDLAGSAAVFHDVTELRRLEKVRTDFVANVSHELRTPITAIRGYAETLKAGALGDPQVAPRMVDIIHRQSERLSELVEELLELSRLEAREVQLRRSEVRLALVAARAADTVRPRAQGKRLTLQLLVPDSLVALGDERALEQVLLNLLDNAVKYTPEGGQVSVRAASEGGRCVVQVHDSGVGIEPRHLSRIFERFYRVDKGRSRDMGGTGLGLSIVKHLLGAMGGDIKVESQPNAGSTFTVFLPLPPAQEAAAG